MKHKLYLLIAASLVVISCSKEVIKTITWLPPKDANGIICVQKCFNDRVKCSKTAAPSTCHLKKIKNQSSPIKTARTHNAKITENNAKNCSIDPKCMPKYQQCFLQCGGQLIIHKEVETYNSL